MNPNTRTRRRAVAIAATTAALGVTLGIAATASANNGSDQRTIRMHTVLVSSTINSAGNGGPGDVVANLFSVTTSTEETGHVDISCTNLPNSEQRWAVSMILDSSSG
jgi:hypothetical protein